MPGSKQQHPWQLVYALHCLRALVFRTRGWPQLAHENHYSAPLGSGSYEIVLPYEIVGPVLRFLAQLPERYTSPRLHGTRTHPICRIEAYNATLDRSVVTLQCRCAGSSAAALVLDTRPMLSSCTVGPSLPSVPDKLLGCKRPGAAGGFLPTISRERCSGSPCQATPTLRSPSTGPFLGRKHAALRFPVQCTVEAGGAAHIRLQRAAKEEVLPMEHIPSRRGSR